MGWEPPGFQFQSILARYLKYLSKAPPLASIALLMFLARCALARRRNLTKCNLCACVLLHPALATGGFTGKPAAGGFTGAAGAGGFSGGVRAGGGFSGQPSSGGFSGQGFTSEATLASGAAPGRWVIAVGNTVLYEHRAGTQNPHHAMFSWPQPSTIPVSRPSLSPGSPGYALHPSAQVPWGQRPRE